MAQLKYGDTKQYVPFLLWEEEHNDQYNINPLHSKGKFYCSLIDMFSGLKLSILIPTNTKLMPNDPSQKSDSGS